MRDALDAALKRRGEWVTPAAYNERHYQYRDSVAEPVTCE